MGKIQKGKKSYKNIVSKRLRFGEVIIDEDLSIEDINDVDAEFYSSEVIEVKEIEKTTHNKCIII